MRKLITSYTLFLWFMRTATLPITIASFYIANDAYDKFAVSPNVADLLALFIGLLGGTICLCYFLAAWVLGGKKEAELP